MKLYAYKLPWITSVSGQMATIHVITFTDKLYAIDNAERMPELDIEYVKEDEA